MSSRKQIVQLLIQLDLAGLSPRSPVEQRIKASGILPARLERTDSVLAATGRGWKVRRPFRARRCRPFPIRGWTLSSSPPQASGGCWSEPYLACQGSPNRPMLAPNTPDTWEIPAAEARYACLHSKPIDFCE